MDASAIEVLADSPLTFIFKVEPPLTGRLRPFTSFVTLLAG